jgi:hypothetical protein
MLLPGAFIPRKPSEPGEKYQTVGHSIKTGRYEFGSKPTTLFCLGDELPLD